MPLGANHPIINFYLSKINDGPNKDIHNQSKKTETHTTAPGNIQYIVEHNDVRKENNRQGDK